jgi:hypothetical protein
MGRIFKIATSVVMIWAVFAPVSAWASRGVIYDGRGSISIAPPADALGELEPRHAIISDTVTAGMTVLTGSNSYAVLKFDDGQIVSMQPNSTLLVRDYIYFPLKVKRSNVDFSMLKGGMRFITGQIGHLNPAAFKVSTPNGIIRVQGTDFYAVMTNDGLYNQVLSGSISLTNAAGVSVLTAGNITLTALSTELPAPVSAGALPATTFSRLAAIPVPKVVQVAVAEPVPVPKPVPEPALVAKSAPVLEPVPAPEPVLATAAVPPPTVGMAGSTAGGAATGGAAAATTMAMAETGIPWIAISIGAGVAAGAAALGGGSSTTTTTTHH